LLAGDDGGISRSQAGVGVRRHQRPRGAGRGHQGHDDDRRQDRRSNKLGPHRRRRRRSHH